MKPEYNPLIEERSSDTLAHIGDMLAFVQTFFSSSDFPGTDYEKSIYLGIYCALDVSRHALMYELERLNRSV
jgi:hypothetical protein